MKQTTESSARKLRRSGIDPALIEVIRNELASIAEEMAIVISRGARSPMVRNGDFSATVGDRGGGLFGIGYASPQQLGQFMSLMPYVLEKVDRDDVAGQAFVANDPFKGWGHMPDVAVVVPVMHPADGLVGFTLAYSHHTDMGGRIPGSMSSKSASSYEEGLRLPVVAIMRNGSIDEALLEVILANVRGGEMWRGDLEAKIAGCQRGAREYNALVDRYDLEVIDEFARYSNERSEDTIRAALASLPDGHVRYEDEFEDAGFGKVEPGLPLRFTLSVQGDSAAVDFDGTSDQVPSAINLPFAQTKAAIYGAFKLLVGPEILLNEGFVRPLSISAPSRSLVNPEYPAAVGGRGPLVGRVRSSVQRALAELAPNRVPVPGETADSLHAVGEDSRGNPFVMLDGFFGGWGARPTRDGIDGLAPMEFGAYGAAPAEYLEREYPVVLEEFGYVPDSAGAGRYRGSLAIRRMWRFRSSAAVMIRTSRLTPSPGLAGGLAGDASSNTLWRAGSETGEELPEEMHLHLEVENGDRIAHVLGGFGGWGDPHDRDPELVLDDVINGKISPDAARASYAVCVVQHGRSWQIDGPGTRSLRSPATMPTPGSGEEAADGQEVVEPE